MVVHMGSIRLPTPVIDTATDRTSGQGVITVCTIDIVGTSYSQQHNSTDPERPAMLTNLDATTGQLEAYDRIATLPVLLDEHPCT